MKPTQLAPVEDSEIATLSPKALALLELLADVTDHRTKAEKAAEVGLSSTYASTISRRPDFIALLHKRVREIVKAELNGVYMALVYAAKRGDVQAARTLLQAAGEITSGNVNVTTLVKTGGDDYDIERRAIEARDAVLAGIAITEKS